MYKLKQILVSGVIGLLGIAPLKASIDEDSLYLSIGQLFDRGMEQNLQLAADRLKEQIADDRARTARASRLPEINIGLNGGFVGQPVVFEHGLSDPTCPDSPDWSQNYAVNVSQPLYHG